MVMDHIVHCLEVIVVGRDVVAHFVKKMIVGFTQKEFAELILAILILIVV